MLTDYWVIAQLLAQFCALALLTSALFFVIKAIRFWDNTIHDEKQLNLERRNYLVGAIVRFTALFQIASLVMFLNTTNNHLPDLITGAMCATGTLSLNDFGYSILYLKSLGVFVYAIYLIINHLDNTEPNYPLTPFKYYLVFPMWFFLVLDLYFMFQYFYQIEPDIIATCCSVSFLAHEHNQEQFLLTSQFLDISLIFFVSSAMILLLSFVYVFLFKYKGLVLRILQLVVAVFFMFNAIHSLKYFFVKYIYGLPSHTCLFDIFFGQYNYVGYLIFASYYTLIISILFLLIKKIFAYKLENQSAALEQKLYLTAFFSLLLAFFVPTAYWVFWEGSL